MEVSGESAGDDAFSCVCVGNKHRSLAWFQTASFTPVFVVVLL